MLPIIILTDKSQILKRVDPHVFNASILENVQIGWAIQGLKSYEFF